MWEPTGVLRVETRRGGVMVTTMNRATKRNALNRDLREAIVSALRHAEADVDTKVVVLSGSGGVFCAGFDLDELNAADDPSEVFAHSTAYHHAVHTFSKPLVAAIEGAAVAGGMDLAVMCDLRVVASDAKFGQPQIKLGVPAAFDLIKTVVPEPAARELCLSGRILDASEAVDLGLAHRVVEPGTALDVAIGLAAEIAVVAGAGTMKQAFVAAQPRLFAESEAME